MMRSNFLVCAFLVLLPLFHLAKTDCYATPSFGAYTGVLPVVAPVQESQRKHFGDSWLFEACYFQWLPPNAAVTILIVLAGALALMGLFAVHCANWLRSSQSKKLEPDLRAALAERDIDKAAHLCERYKWVKPAPVISSIIAQTHAVHPLDPISVEGFKQIWLSTASSEFSKWMRAARFVHWIKLIVILAPVLNLLVDISRSLKGIDLISGEGVFSFYWVLSRDLPILSLGIFLAILGFVVEAMVSGQATKQQIRTDDLAIDLLVSYSGKPRRQALTRYEHGRWMSSTRNNKVLASHASLRTKS